MIRCCAAGLLDDRAHDLGAFDGRRADLVADHQHVGEFDPGASLALDLLDRELVVGGDRVLLSTRADNGDHDDILTEALSSDRTYPYHP